MKCILYSITGSDINIDGTFINVIEYFLYLYELDKEFKLVLVDGKQKHVDVFDDTIKQRYNLEGIEGYKENIKTISLSEFIKTKFNSVLIVNAITIKRIRGLIRAEKIIVISDRKTDKDEYILEKNKYPVTYYGEMPFEYHDVKYKMKFLFHRYKPLKYEENNTYVSTHIKDKKLVSSMIGYDNYILRNSRLNIDDFMCKFNHLVYITTPERYDPSPRLFIECKFYNKTVDYINPMDIRDGGWYRYQDYLHEPIKNRYFSKHDLVIKEFI